jgi:hypothetical protein
MQVWDVDMYADAAHADSFVPLIADLVGVRKNIGEGTVTFRAPETFARASAAELERYDLAMILSSDDRQTLGSAAANFVQRRGIFVAHYTWQRAELELEGLPVVTLAPPVAVPRSAQRASSRKARASGAGYILPLLPKGLAVARNSEIQPPGRKLREEGIVRTILVVGLRGEAIGDGTSYFSKDVEDLSRVIQLLRRLHDDRARDSSASAIAPRGLVQQASHAQPAWQLVLVSHANEATRELLDKALGEGVATAAMVAHDDSPAPLPWWRWRTDCDAACLLSEAERASYVLPLAPSGGSYHNVRLTAAIPLALSFGIPLVMDRDLCSQYGLDGAAVQYHLSASEVLRNALALPDQAPEEYFRLKESARRAAETARFKNKEFFAEMLFGGA